MNCKIVNEEAFFVLGKSSVHTVADGKNRESIPAFWAQCNRDGTMKVLLDAACDMGCVFGICYGGQEGSDEFRYSIAVRCEQDASVPDGFEKTSIPARTWAVFGCVGAMPHAIQALWDEITLQYFPRSPYQPTGEWEIEAYPDGDAEDENYRCEIRIPVKKK